MSEAISKMLDSIHTTDIYILVAAIIEFMIFLFVLILAKQVTVEFKRKTKVSNGVLVTFYNIFTTGISIFPLLGMLGTVSGLLGLDLSAGDMANIKNNFFMALTSTAWGIVFSLIFKILHSFIEYYLEIKIIETKAVVDNYNGKNEKDKG